MRPRWRKVLADLWENKPRALLVVISIAAGIFAVGMVAGAYVIIPSAMDSSYSGSNPSNIVIQTGSFDRDFLEGVRRVDGVAEAEGQRSVDVRLRIGEDEWVSMELVARSDLTETRLDHLIPQTGSTTPAEREVLLVSKLAEKYDLSLGQTLEIELSDGTRRQLPVTGIVRDLTIGKRGFMSEGVGFITTDTLEWLHQPADFDRLYVTVSGGTSDKAYIQDVAARIVDRLEKSGRQAYQIDLYQKNKHPMSSLIVAILNVLAALGVLLVFLSGALIANTLAALLRQHLRQIGVMKLVGARRAQVIGMYLALIMTFGVLALAISIVPAAWGAYATSAMAADLINFVIPEPSAIPIVPQAVFVQTLMALLIPLLAGLWPVMRGSRITVQEALTSTGLSQDARPSKKAGPRKRLRLPSVPRPLLISIRNTFRRRGRLMLTLFTLTLGGAIFISVFNVRVGLDATVQRSMRYFQADVNLDMARLYPIENIARQLEAVPGIERVEAWAGAQAQVVDAQGDATASVTVLAPPAESTLVEPILLAGRWLLPSDETAIAVSEAFWRDNPDLQPGDTLRLKIANEERDWVIVGIFQFTGADELHAFANYDYLAKVLHHSGRSAMYRIVSSEHGEAAQETLSAAIDAHLRGLGYRVSSVKAGESLAQTAADSVMILIKFLLVMALLTALVGSIGLAGTLSLNVLERTREIGVMRAIGAHNGIVARLVIDEGLIIGLIGYVAAALVSVPITKLLSDIVMRAIFNTATPLVFTPLGYAIWLAAVLVLTVVASALPARNACRLTIREVLAYE
ncbi:MAG: ABC transporter permease [Anaerolineae bacterium]